MTTLIPQEWIDKAELGNAWTPREHTAESLKLARERESNRRLLQK